MKFLLLTGMFYLFLVGGAWAQGQTYFKGSLWESEALTENIAGFDHGNLNDDFQHDVACITPHKIIIYSFNSGGLEKLAVKNTGSAQENVRIHLGDWDDDGGHEILVTGFVKDAVFSDIYRLDGKKLVRESAFETLVQPLNGELYAQEYLGNGQWSATIQRLTWQGKWLKGQKVKIHRGLSANPVSLYGWAGWEDNEKHGFQSVAAVHEFTGRDALGLRLDNYFVVPVRTLHLGDTLFAVKHALQLNNVVGARPVIKSSRIVRFSRTGGSFVEQNELRHSSGYIRDVQSIDFDGGGAPEIFVLFEPGAGGLFKGRKVKRVFTIFPAGETKDDTKD